MFINVNTNKNDAHGGYISEVKYAQECLNLELDTPAQQVRALATLSEDQGSIPSTHMVTHNHLELHPPKTLHTILTS